MANISDATGLIIIRSNKEETVKELYNFLSGYYNECVYETELLNWFEIIIDEENKEMPYKFQTKFTGRGEWSYWTNIKDTIKKINIDKFIDKTFLIEYDYRDCELGEKILYKRECIFLHYSNEPIIPDGIKILCHEDLDYTWDNIVSICKSNAFIIVNDVEHCLENKEIDKADNLYGKDTISRALGLVETFKELEGYCPRLSAILTAYHHVP